MENSYVFYRSLRESREDWEEINESYIKGYAYMDSELLEGVMLLDVLVSGIQNNQLNQVLLSLNGFFGAILKYKSDIYLITDKIRSIPIIYTIRDKVYCADSGESANKLIYNSSINNESEIELSALGYLSGGDTLINGVYYVPAGEYIIINSQHVIKKTTYYSFNSKKKRYSKEELFCLSKERLEESFIRAISSIGEYSNILIPLSGGYDSRLIACLCKKAGLSNVVCFTYGKKDSFEVKTSKMVAEALNYKWIFVEYNQKVWEETLKADIFNDYFIFAGCLTGTPHFQDFPALLQLKKEGIIDNNSVIIPGHSGDLLGGSKIPVEIIENQKNKYDCSEIVDFIYTHFFDLNELKSAFIDEEKKRIAKILKIEDIGLINIDNALDIIECEWFIKTKISNFIVNSVRAYEFLGLRWRIPLWDVMYASIWYQIPWDMKFNSSLYNRFLFETYFQGYNVALKKQKTISQDIKYLLKKALSSSLKKVYRESVAVISRSKVHENINAFEYVINNMEKGLNEGSFSYIRRFNHANINASTCLNYIQRVKMQL